MHLDAITGSTISLRGNIKTVSDYMEIKNHLQKVIETGPESITLVLRDSSTITSSVIGHLFKIINLNGIAIHIHARNERLLKVLSDLNLNETFHVQAIRE